MSTPKEHGDGIVSTPKQHGDGIVSTPKEHGDGIVSTPKEHGDGIVSTPKEHIRCRLRHKYSEAFKVMAQMLTLVNNLACCI